MKKRRVYRTGRISFLASVPLGLLWLCTGCALVAPLTKSDYSAIQAGQKSLVLLRVTCEITYKGETEPVRGCIKGENASIALGDFETGGILKPVIVPTSLSAEMLEQGWTYFILEPGIYYLGFQGQRRTDAFTYDAQWQRVQRWRMDVEPGSPIVYAGTMHLQCASDWFLFGARYCCFIRKETIKNEEELARTLVSDHLETMGSPKTALMKMHTCETIILGTPKPEE